MNVHFKTHGADRNSVKRDKEMITESSFEQSNFHSFTLVSLPSS